jgi:NACHT domain
MSEVRQKRASVTQRVSNALKAANRRDVRVEDEYAVSFLAADRMVNDRQTIVAGSAQTLCHSHLVGSEVPIYVVIEDGASPTTIARLQSAMFDPDRLLNVSRFYDLLWSVEQMEAWIVSASVSANSAERAIEPRVRGHRSRGGFVKPNLVERDKPQTGEPVGRSIDLADWVRGDNDVFGDYDGRVVFVSGAAGMGKTEYTRWLLRFGAMQQKATGTEVFRRPRSLVVRIPLRDVDYLSLAGLRQYISAQAGIDDLSESFFHLLLVECRIVLLLDGLDEIGSLRNDLEEGFSELEQTAQAGGRILVTSRLSSTSAFSPLQHIRRIMERDEPIHAVALELRPFTREQSIELLVLNGETEADAARVVDKLPPDIRGVPLFLKWSQEIDAANLRGAGAHGFLGLVAAVCDRESKTRRINNPPDRQLASLREIALERLSNPVQQSDLEYFIEDDPQFMYGPHALLSLDGDGTISFRHEAFEAVLLAQALNEEWASLVDADLGAHRSFLQMRLSRGPLNDLTLEYLAELTTCEMVSRSWEIAALNPDRRLPHLRWNLLNIALNLVERTIEQPVTASGHAGHRELQQYRSSLLTRCLPDQDLSDMRLDQIVLSQFAWRGWNLSNLSASGAEFRYCDFQGCTHDESLALALLAEPSGLIAG